MSVVNLYIFFLIKKKDNTKHSAFNIYLL